MPATPLSPEPSLSPEPVPHFDSSTASSSTPPLPVDPSSRYPSRVRQPPPHLHDYECYFSALCSIHEPASYREASSDPLWQKAIAEELDALTKTRTWDLVSLPPGKSVIGCKWIFKVKTTADGSIDRYKARLVAKGYTQEYGIDYEETFAPVARLTSVRLLIALATVRQWDLFQMDVKNAFLNGTIAEEVYMKPPPGYSHLPGQVCKLRRALYGLKQAPRAWFSMFCSKIVEFGYTQSSHDSALFTRCSSRGIVLLLLYVDDMVITGDDRSGISDHKAYLSSCFEMKDLGPLRYFLGLEVLPLSGGYGISQVKYASDLVNRAGLSDNKTSDTPLELNVKFRPSDGELLADPTLYRQLLFSMLTGLEMFLIDGPQPGYSVFLGYSPISWRSKKQSTVSRSSTEAEYRALADTTSEIVWLRWLLQDMGVHLDSSSPLYCDNKSAMQIAHNAVFHERTKHIEVDCHFVRHHCALGTVDLLYVPSEDQVADLFTKSLTRSRLGYLCSKLKLCSFDPS
ncbi:hypothetical protein H6P81_012695 [Aristolochia fimbriata]|uniref:Reverse transcriptase Ty1/copia-type domain-containing protein n=1 Tax=Aristolochia fimbriata TaxID=158543 RepID=A0AAV7EFT6_ARIFI|nr:hypothetical protein H6P81_012695 [Aristolochia fimbriata]